jgi:hypothetical protein
MDFDGAAGQAADVSHIFQSGREDHDGKRTGHLIFAEVKEVNALRANLNSKHLSCDAIGFADVLACLVKGDAIGGAEAGGG